MTKLVAISQRVAIDPGHGEKRDCLDQRWSEFLAACGLAPLLLPNRPATAIGLLQAIDPCGLILSGGNDLGQAPERDDTEAQALAFARSCGLPVLGVCRGMQVILNTFAVPLRRVANHAGTRHALSDGRIVNSYHQFAAVGDAGPLTVLARSDDGVIEAVRHPVEAVHAVMWHPERCTPEETADLRLFQNLFLESPAS